MKCEIMQISDFSESTLALRNLYSFPLEKILFFDIETTGLSARSSYLYLIGCAYYSDGNFYLKQWFLEHPSEEKEVLIQFYHFMKYFDALVHFNGTTFDMPYIQNKWKRYALPYDFSHIESIDLYKLLQPYKSLFRLPNLKQKTLEDYLGRNRNDPFDGGQLIAVYHDFLATHDSRGLAYLLLHNKEDVEGLTALPAMLAYIQTLNGSFEVADCSLTAGKDVYGQPCSHLNVCLTPPIPLPAVLTYQYENYFLKMQSDRIFLSETSTDETFHKYYENYKDYYYLPEEDTIIPKSLASGIAKDRRKAANKTNCYIRFQANEQFLKNHDAVYSYAAGLFRFLSGIKSTSIK